MNKDLEDDLNCSTDISLLVNVSSTQDKSTQIEETISNNEIKKELIVDLNTPEGYQYSQDFDREEYFRAIKEKELLNKTFSPTQEFKEIIIESLNSPAQGSNSKPIIKRTGSRSDKDVKHVELPIVIRKRIIKTKQNFTMDVEKWGNFIPTCVGQKNVSEFINNCEIAIKEVAVGDQQLLLKIINSKLAGNALEACKYRETDTWESIKTILQGAFEHKASEKSLTIALSCARMNPGESVTKFASRIEELYYKLCTASTEKMSDTEAKTIKKQNKKMAMIVFMTGLPEHLKLRLKARDPKTLEEAMTIAIEEEMEFDSEQQISKVQDSVQRQDLSKNGRNNNTYENGNRQYNNNGNQGFGRGNNTYNNRGGYNNNNGQRNFNNSNNNNFNRGGNNNGYKQNYNLRNNNNFRNRASANTGCYICGKNNHFAKDCWQSRQDMGNSNRQAISNNSNRQNNFNNNSRQNNDEGRLHCSYCNKVGHVIADCYTKARNEKQSAGVTKNGRASQPGIKLVSQVYDPSSERDDVSM